MDEPSSIWDRDIDQQESALRELLKGDTELAPPQPPSLMDALQSIQSVQQGPAAPALSAPGAGTGLAGGGIAAAIPMMMLAGMQQQQTPFAQGGNAFLNAFYAAQGRSNPNPQPQSQFGPMQMLAMMKAVDESQHRQRSDLLAQQKFGEELKKASLAEENTRDIMAQRKALAERSGDLTFLKMLEGVNTATPGGQQFYSQEMARLASKFGAAGVDPQFFRQKFNLTPDARKDLEVVALGVSEGSLSMEDAQAKFPNVDPQYLATTVKMMKDPLLRRAAGIPSDEDLRGHAAEIAKKQLDAWAPSHGYEITGKEAPKFLYAADKFRALTGKAIYQADESDTADLKALAEAKQYGVDQVEKERLKLLAEHRETMDITNKNMINRQLAAESRQPVSNKSVIDKTTGILMTPTKAEWAADPRRYRFPTAVEEQNLEYLGTALPNFRTLGRLVDRILVDKGPDNLINALQGRVSTTMRTDPNWVLMDGLLADTNVELTRALGGGGQFRTTLLDYIKKANITGRDTREVAHTVLGMMENQIENRRQSIISGGDLGALKEVPLPANPVSKMQRARKIGTTGPIITAPAGTPLPPGYEVVP